MELSITYEPREQDAPLEILNDRLAQISKWEEKGLVSFVLNKTQLLVVERRNSALQINFSKITRGN